jgi:hypothetical protein
MNAEIKNTKEEIRNLSTEQTERLQIAGSKAGRQDSEHNAMGHCRPVYLSGVVWH